jgi:hypothetical protein
VSGVLLGSLALRWVVLGESAHGWVGPGELGVGRESRSVALERGIVPAGGGPIAGTWSQRERDRLRGRLVGNDLRLDPPRTAGLSVRNTGIAIAEGHLDHDGRERVGSPGGAGGG